LKWLDTVVHEVVVVDDDPGLGLEIEILEGGEEDLDLGLVIEGGGEDIEALRVSIRGLILGLDLGLRVLMIGRSLGLGGRGLSRGIDLRVERGEGRTME